MNCRLISTCSGLLTYWQIKYFFPKNLNFKNKSKKEMEILFNNIFFKKNLSKIFKNCVKGEKK